MNGETCVLEEKKQKKGNGRLGRWLSRFLVRLQAALCVLAAYLALGNPVFASGTGMDGVITSSFDTLFNLVATIISAIGSILTLWGIGEWGIAFQTQDGSTQAHAFKRIAGGLVMILAPQIITYFV